VEISTGDGCFWHGGVFAGFDERRPAGCQSHRRGAGGPRTLCQGRAESACHATIAQNQQPDVPRRATARLVLFLSAAFCPAFTRSGKAGTVGGRCCDDKTKSCG